MATIAKEINLPIEHIDNIFGGFDSNIRMIEKKLGVSFISRNDTVKITGEEASVVAAFSVVDELLKLSMMGNTIATADVNYALSMNPVQLQEHALSDVRSDVICHTTSGKPVVPKTLGQSEYVNSIRDNMITFGIGPAGTGKTYLAMAMAITAFTREEVGRIILTRPAIEAGEKLGFLPGDLQSKVDPYLRPLYDALYQIMGADSFVKNMEKGLIEVAPLAYMRGRTLDNSFIILDEAQNTTSAQMKMFLTRIGFGSKAVITGDNTQKDLPQGTKSGLEEAMKVLKNIDDIKICQLTSKDVVRHPLVMQIVNAYEKYEKSQKSSDNKKPNNYRSNNYRNNN